MTGKYKATTKGVSVVDGVKVDITVRDTGAGEDKAEKVMMELKTHMGRIQSAYEQEADPVDTEFQAENMPLMMVNWESVFDDE